VNINESMDMIDRKKKKALLKKSTKKAIYIIMLVLSLTYLNTMFVYCFVYSVNLINAYVGLEIPLNDLQVLAVSLELLHPLKIMVVTFLMGLFYVLFIFKVVDKGEKIDLWKVTVRGLILCYVVANIIIVLGFSVHKLDVTGWLFNTTMLDPIF